MATGPDKATEGMDWFFECKAAGQAPGSSREGSVRLPSCGLAVCNLRLLNIVIEDVVRCRVVFG